MISLTYGPFIEKWEDVKDYLGLYRISNYGRVYSLKNKSMLKPKKDKDGYLEVNLSSLGIAKMAKVHRLVGIAFLNNECNKPTINHKNGFKNENAFYNLEWATRAENNLHARINKLAKGSLKSSESPYAKEVLNTATGEVFKCVEDAANSVKIKKNTLTKMLNGGNRNSTNLIYL